MHLALHTLVVTPSIGISLYPSDGADVDTLLRNADLAMYFAKRKGPGMYAFFDAAMNEAALRRFTLEAKLRGALERGEFMLHYQPQFDVTTGAVSGMEALLRWTNDDLGVVPPAEFVPVAEETGLDTAHRRMGAAHRMPAGQGVAGRGPAGRAHGRERLGAAVRAQGLPCHGGGYHSRNGHRAIDAGARNHRIGGDERRGVGRMALRQLKDLGVRLAIDDFGTGYSSFGRLRNFAVDRLKIDQSFMTSLMERADDRAIAAAIIAMSRSLRISVTAEGVENFPQLLFLQEHDCHEAQGFLFSRALPPADAHSLLRRAAEMIGAPAPNA